MSIRRWNNRWRIVFEIWAGNREGEMHASMEYKTVDIDRHEHYDPRLPTHCETIYPSRL